MIKCIQQKQQQFQQQLQQQPQQLQGYFGNFFQNVQTHLAQTHLAFSDERLAPEKFLRSSVALHYSSALPIQLVSLISLTAVKNIPLATAVLLIAASMVDNLSGVRKLGANSGET